MHFNDDLPLLVPPCPSPQDLADLKLHQTHFFCFVFFTAVVQNKLSLSALSTCFKKVRMCLLEFSHYYCHYCHFLCSYMNYFLGNLFHFGSPRFDIYTNLYSIAPNTELESASDF